MDFKTIIESRGLKQRWIAKQLKVTDAMLSMFLKGKTGMCPEKIKKLKKILKVRESKTI